MKKFFCCVISLLIFFSVSVYASPVRKITASQNEMIAVGFLQYQSNSKDLYVFVPKKHAGACNDPIIRVMQTSYPSAAGVGWSFGQITQDTEINLNGKEISASDLAAINEQDVLVYGKTHLTNEQRYCDYVFIMLR